jgi:Mrp family chromosome partitioning ATPase
VLGSLISHYLRKHIEIHRSADAYNFLSQQTDQVRARLAETEEELRRIKNEAGIVSVEDTKRSLLTRMDDLNRELQEAESALAASDAKQRVLHPFMATGGEQSASAQSDTNNSAYYARAYEKLARLQERVSELQVTFTEDSIPVQNIRAQIADIERTLGPLTVEGRELGNVALMDAQINGASIEARIQVLKQQIEQTRAQAAKVDEIEGRVVLLERNKEIQEANYKYFSQSLERARIDDALDAGKISNIAIVQPATYPAEKLRPHLLRRMVMALALGLACGLGLAFAHELFLDRSFRRPSEMEPVLRMPMLISIPWIQGIGDGGAGKAVALLEPHDEPAPPDQGPVGPVNGVLREYCETLRDRLLTALGQRADGPCVFGITSCSRGVGVTTTASGLAFALSCTGEDKVLLMDADPGHGAPYRIFGGDAVAGAVDLTTDRHGNTTVVERSLYHVSPSGRMGSPMTSTPSQRFQDIVRHALKSGCRYVVLDLPPVSDTSATLRVAGLASGIVLVVEAEKDHRDAVLRARDLLTQAEGRLLGAVLNKTRSWVPRWLYTVY